MLAQNVELMKLHRQPRNLHSADSDKKNFPLLGKEGKAGIDRGKYNVDLSFYCKYFSASLSSAACVAFFCFSVRRGMTSLVPGLSSEGEVRVLRFAS